MSLENVLEIYGTVLYEEPMGKHTTYRIGGPVRWFIQPHDLTSLMRILQILDDAEVPWIVTGRGSNLLVPDERFDGAVINLDKTFNDFYFEPDGTLFAQAGCALPLLANEAMRNSLTGLEFASGIPGSLGGGLYMNAGAYKSDISKILEEVLVLKDRTVCWIPKDELDYSYRHSAFQDHPDWVILAARFRLDKGDRNAIRALMENRQSRRMAAQPLSDPCAGSTFRNPDSMPAWKIIDELGLRGRQIGGARISDKHSNFIINAGGATCADVQALIELVKTSCMEKYGIELIEEVECPKWRK